MRALLPSDVEIVEVPAPTGRARGLSLSQNSLRKLGDRLQAIYDTGDEPLPARLNELIERLRRRERAKD